MPEAPPELLVRDLLGKVKGVVNVSVIEIATAIVSVIAIGGRVIADHVPPTTERGIETGTGIENEIGTGTEIDIKLHRM
jgi:hypothetical protein